MPLSFVLYQKIVKKSTSCIENVQENHYISLDKFGAFFCIVIYNKLKGRKEKRMALLTFKGGIHPDDGKSLAKDKADR